MTFENIKHVAPQDCISKDGKRCDICFGPMPIVDAEHPAARAARMIKELHEQNIALIDGGQIFYKTDEATGEQVDVSLEMRKQCAEQIQMCEHVIEHAPFMKPESFTISTELLAEVTEMIKQKTDDAEVVMPEIGNYDHKAD